MRLSKLLNSKLIILDSIVYKAASATLIQEALHKVVKATPNQN